MVLRCTRRVLDLLGARPVALIGLRSSEDDWYLNLLWLERRKSLLFTHAATLFSAFVADVRAADVRPIGPYAITVIDAELRSEGLPPGVFGDHEPDSVQLAKTASRKRARVHERHRRPLPLPDHRRRRPRQLRHRAVQPPPPQKPCTTAATAHRLISSPSGSV